jgi:hypothetical protein
MIPKSASATDHALNGWCHATAQRMPNEPSAEVITHE